MSAVIIDFGKRHARVTALYDGDLFTNGDGTPRVSWWVKPALWAERELVEVISRPIEDRALLNIYLQARALEHLDEYRFTLSPWEHKAFALEQTCKRDHAHVTGWALYEWVGERMGGYAGEWTPRRVKGLLDDVTEIVQACEIERLLERVEAERKRGAREFREIVREVVFETAAETWARAA